MKFLDKFYNKAEILWMDLTWSKLYANKQTPPHVRSPVGSFRLKEILSLHKSFQIFASCKPDKGDSALLWIDSWTGQAQTLKDHYPQLFSFTKKPKCSLQYYTEQDASRLFSLPLSQQVADQLTELENVINELNMDDSCNDLWSYSWAPQGSVAAKHTTF